MPVAKAIRYMLNHWDGLCVFLADGRVELDTNTIERLHRVVATTRKNALFAGADSGARSWAIFTSLIQSARMSGLENFFCKIKQFRRIATRYDKTDTSFAAMIQLVGSVLATR